MLKSYLYLDELKVNRLYRHLRGLTKAFLLLLLHGEWEETNGYLRCSCYFIYLFIFILGG